MHSLCELAPFGLKMECLSVDGSEEVFPSAPTYKNTIPIRAMYMYTVGLPGMAS